MITKGIPTHPHVKKAINIHIGDLYVTREPTQIQTVLGSCVAVCMYDLQAQVGGMNHILLPGSRARERDDDESARYGITAMEQLINELMKMGANRYRLRAKAFGGAHLLSSVPLDKGVGKKNIRVVTHFLEMEKIPLVSSDFGGFDTRIIHFCSATGEVLLKRRSSGLTEKIVQEETRKLQEVRDNISREMQVDLF